MPDSFIRLVVDLCGPLAAFLAASAPDPQNDPTLDSPLGRLQVDVVIPMLPVVSWASPRCEHQSQRLNHGSSFQF